MVASNFSLLSLSVEFFFPRYRSFVIWISLVHINCWSEWPDDALQHLLLPECCGHLLSASGAS